MREKQVTEMEEEILELVDMLHSQTTRIRTIFGPGITITLKCFKKA